MTFEHLLTSRLIIWVSTFVKGLFKSLVHFSIGLSVFFLLFCPSSLYVLDTNPSSVICIHVYHVFTRKFGGPRKSQSFGEGNDFVGRQEREKLCRSLAGSRYIGTSIS